MYPYTPQMRAPGYIPAYPIAPNAFSQQVYYQHQQLVQPEQNAYALQQLQFNAPQNANAAIHAPTVTNANSHLAANATQQPPKQQTAQQPTSQSTKKKKTSKADYTYDAEYPTLPQKTTNKPDTKSYPQQAIVPQQQLHSVPTQLQLQTNPLPVNAPLPFPTPLMASPPQHMPPMPQQLMLTPPPMYYYPNMIPYGVADPSMLMQQMMHQGAMQQMATSQIPTKMTPFTSTSSKKLNLSRYAPKFTPTHHMRFLFKELTVMPPKTQSELMWERLLSIIDESMFSSSYIKGLSWEGELSIQEYKSYFMTAILKEYEQRQENRLKYESLCEVPFRAPPSKDERKKNPSALYFSIHKQTPDLVLEMLVPGLSEGRPRLYRDNLVRIQLVEDGSYHEWVGRVISTSRTNIVLVGGISRSILNYYPSSSNNSQYSSKPLPTNAYRFHISFPLSYHDERVMLYVLHTMSDEFTQKLFAPCQYNKNVQLHDTSQQDVESPSSKRPNTEQRLFCHAVQNPLRDVHSRSSSICLLHGPPGTGKTTSVAAAVKGIKGGDSPQTKILLCAPSDSAADHLAQVLMNDFSNKEMYRLYSTDRDVSFIPEQLLKYTTITSDMTHGFPVQRVSLPKGGAAELQQYQVVVATCKDCIYLKLLGMPFNHFTHLFIDEAAQATEPESLIPMMFCASQNIALIGDPKQLGANVVCEEAQAMGYGRSLLERLISLPGQDYIMLKKNYRHDARIIRIPWQLFYKHINGRVNTIEYMKKGHEIDWSKHPLKKGTSGLVREYPVQFFGGKFVDEEKDGSWLCVEEATKIVDIIRDLRVNRGFDAEEFGVIAPYRSQVFEIRRQLRAAGFSNVNVGTVMDFQGNEKRIVIISNTRAASLYNPHLSDESFRYEDKQKTEYADMGFVNNPKAFNVAITRARGLVIFVGDPRAMQDASLREYLFVCLAAGTFNGEVPADLERLFQQSTDKVDSHRQMERTLRSFSVFAEVDESGPLFEHIIQC